MNDRRTLVAATIAGLFLAASAWAAQDKVPAEQDDPVKKLLGELGAKPVAPQDRPAEPAKDGDKPAAPAPKAGEPSPAKPGDPAPPARPAAEGDGAGAGDKGRKPTAPKEKDLDDFLEKLGKTEETPSPKGRPMPGAGEPDPAPPAGEKKADALPEPSKKLDQRLEEILGRKPKKKGSDQEKDGGGMLGEAIKKMREVEQRLEQPDTGDETRQKQGEIVKNLDEVMKQIRKQAQQKKMQKSMAQAGQQKGQQQGNEPGTEAGDGQRGAEKPRPVPSQGTDATAWGHLPPSLREASANIFKEGYLPAKADLIKRYYLSVNKKGLARGE